MRIEVTVRTYNDNNHYYSSTTREFSIDVTSVQAMNLKLSGVINPLVQSCVEEHIELSNKDES